MVGPGEVDNTLQEETAEECAKFGKVKKCLIFEVPGKKVPDDQAVRIFVQFADKDGAHKGFSLPSSFSDVIERVFNAFLLRILFLLAAIQALHGRFFAKRMVKATYYDETRFAKLDLAPNQSE